MTNELYVFKLVKKKELSPEIGHRICLIMGSRIPQKATVWAPFNNAGIYSTRNPEYARIMREKSGFNRDYVEMSAPKVMAKAEGEKHIPKQYLCQICEEYENDKVIGMRIHVLQKHKQRVPDEKIEKWINPIWEEFHNAKKAS